MGKKAGKHVRGSVLGQAQEHAQRSADASAQDQLLAQKLEDEQAQQTMRHLIENERKEQRKAFEQERESTHALLDAVRTKLHQNQDQIIQQVQHDASNAVHKVEEELSKTSIAKTIEDVVKKKLAKRLDELKSEGEHTVHDVSSQISALKHRVRRLRRQQRRFQEKESSMEQNMMRESHERDLGESASVGQHESIASEMGKLRMEQMMRQLALPPQMQPAAQSEEHMALMKMQEEMANLR